MPSLGGRPIELCRFDFNLSPPQTETIGITNVDDPPVLSNVASSATVHIGATATLSPNTTVSDPDDLTLVGGTVVVSGGFAGDGDVLSASTSGTSITATYTSGNETLTLSGTDTLAHYQSVLDSVTFTAGSVASGTNPRTVTWQVNDGEAANNLSTPVQTTVTITTLDSTRPTVTPTSLAVIQSHLHTVAASTLFTASDADFDPIVQYDFWDTGAGGGHWIINGTNGMTNADNFVPAAQLSQVTYQSGAGTDTLYVRASDGTGFGPWSQAFTVTDTAPVVTATSANVKVSHQNPVSATSLFTASEADTDSIVQYDFYDNGQAGGHWLLNGVAQPNNQILSFSASQLPQITYQGGAGTETIWERASDGIQYGAWVSLNATDTAPVVTPTNANVNVGHGTVAATSLFTAADADTDGVVQYDFYDSGQAGGHWLLNGVAQPDNQILSFSASQLSQITYRGGAGTETIWERASDGIQYGAWVSLNATGTETAPVVAPTSARIVVRHNSSVAASTLFTVYDQDGDPITQYDFWDTGAGGGHWSHQRQRPGKQHGDRGERFPAVPGHLHAGRGHRHTLCARERRNVVECLDDPGLHRHRRRAGLDPRAQLRERGGEQDLCGHRAVHGDRRRRRWQLPSTISGMTARAAAAGSSTERRREATWRSW